MNPIIDRRLGDFLITNSCDVPQHPSRRVTRSIAHLIFSGDPAELQITEDLIKNRIPGCTDDNSARTDSNENETLHNFSNN